MKILIYNPFDNRWNQSLIDAFNKSGHNVKLIKIPTTQDVDWSDRILSTWADENTRRMSIYLNKNNKMITYIRSYELYGDIGFQINWDVIRAVIYCSNHVKEMANFKWKILKYKQQHIIPNWIDLSNWPFYNKKPNGKIAIICYINQKKGLQLLPQLLHILPEKYSIHHIGKVQDESLIFYLQEYYEKFRDRMNFYGEISPSDVPEFLSDKTYILSLSIKEGNPMNIIEAMACGLKPIIHAWPGANEQFGNICTFRYLSEVPELLEGEYEPIKYREFVEKNHSLNNCKKLVEIVCA